MFTPSVSVPELVLRAAIIYAFVLLLRLLGKKHVGEWLPSHAIVDAADPPCGPPTRLPLHLLSHLEAVDRGNGQFTSARTASVFSSPGGAVSPSSSRSYSAITCAPSSRMILAISRLRSPIMVVASEP